MNESNRNGKMCYRYSEQNSFDVVCRSVQNRIAIVWVRWQSASDWLCFRIYRKNGPNNNKQMRENDKTARITYSLVNSIRAKTDKYVCEKIDFRSIFYRLMDFCWFWRATDIQCHTCREKHQTHSIKILREYFIRLTMFFWLARISRTITAIWHSNRLVRSIIFVFDWHFLFINNVPNSK